MGRAAVFTGTGWALVRIASGEYVAVDTNSFDALPYLLGRPIEPHAVHVFRCFLRPGATVLDIGANFGLYAAIAGSAVRPHGRVFAFEGNPHTFDLLLKTLSANGLLGRPVVWPFNLLVSDTDGRGTLYVSDKALGGASMIDIGRDGAQEFAKAGLHRRAVENGMTRIDTILPPDCPVDLVKIDVEGHEPLVIRGMKETIARSPSLRMLIEYNDEFLAHTVPAPQALSEIHDLGFRVCKITRDLGIELLDPGEGLRGHWELLLTRTPEDDIRTITSFRMAWKRRLQPWLRWRR